MPSPQANAADVFHGRLLALTATIVMPGVIAGSGLFLGYPPDIVVPALMLWGAGTSLWLRHVWPYLRATR
jgi:hypothetical protein